MNNCPVSPDKSRFDFEAFPQKFTADVNAAFDLVHTPAGGSCLIHAFLLGLAKPYQQLLSDLDRQRCGDVFRRHVLGGTEYLGDFIESDQEDLMEEPAIFEKSVRADRTDGTVYVYKNLEAGTVPNVLSDIFKINVLILSPYGQFQLINKYPISPFIVIYGDGGHYHICFFKGHGTIVDRVNALKFSESIRRKIETENAERLARAQSVVSPDSLAALIGLEAIPLKSSLKYPSIGVDEFTRYIDKKKVFRIDEWMTLFIAENNFEINLAEPRIEVDTDTLDLFSANVKELFNVVKTINTNNTSLIHSYLFAISKKYKNLLLDEDRQTCVNVFIEKILKTIYLDGFKSEKKYTFLNNVISTNLLLLKKMHADKIDKIINFSEHPVMIIYFDGSQYKVCVIKSSKKFYFSYKNLNLF